MNIVRWVAGVSVVGLVAVAAGLLAAFEQLELDIEAALGGHGK